jgi:hypothetical protein
LTIGTNKLVGTKVEPQGGVPVTLEVESNRTTRGAAPPINFRGQTDSNGKVKVPYDPSSDPRFTGGVVQFKTCRTDVSPPACAAARALFRRTMSSPRPNQVPMKPRRSPAPRPTQRFRCRKRRDRDGSKGSKGSKGMSKRGKGSKRSKSSHSGRTCRMMRRKPTMRRKRTKGGKSAMGSKALAT